MSRCETLMDRLSGYLDCLYESGCLSNKEEEEMNQLEDDIADYIHKLEDENNALRNKIKRKE